MKNIEKFDEKYNLLNWVLMGKVINLFLITPTLKIKLFSM